MRPGRSDQPPSTARLDSLLATLDGTPSGGRYTDQAMRDVWQGRHAGRPWGDVASFADTAEAAIRIPVLAALHPAGPAAVLADALANVTLTHRDPFIVGQSLAFALIVHALIEGVPLAEVSSTVPRWRERHGLRFASVIGWLGEGSGTACRAEASFFDALLQPGWACAAAADLAIRIEPASAACRLFGLACSLGFMLPAAYYLAARFPNDFAGAVLAAINGGGNNMARAALTGAVAGAAAGLSGIPRRLIDGLIGHERYLQLAGKVAESADGDS